MKWKALFTRSNRCLRTGNFLRISTESDNRRPKKLELLNRSKPCGKKHRQHETMHVSDPLLDMPVCDQHARTGTGLLFPAHGAYNTAWLKDVHP